MHRGPRRRLPPGVALSLALVLLTVLAGCAGGLTGSRDAAGAPYDTPLNANGLTSHHTERLRDAGSFTVEYTVTSSLNGEERAANTTVEVDTETGRVFSVQDGSDVHVEAYGDGDGAGFVRLGSGGDARYVRADAGSSRATAVSVERFLDPGIGSAVGEMNFTTNGTRQVAGERTWVYEASATQTAPETVDLDVSANVSVRLFVAADGLVRRMRVDVESTDPDTPVSLTSVVTYTDVGSTDVTEPAWLATAKNRTA